MTDHVTVRVDRGQFRYDYEQYERGEELEVPQRVVDRHPNSLEVVDDSTESEEADDSVEPVPEDELDPHPEDLNVEDIESRVEDVDDLALLKGLKQAEKNSDNRSTATDAIQDRIDAITE